MFTQSEGALAGGFSEHKDEFFAVVLVKLAVKYGRCAHYGLNFLDDLTEIVVWRKIQLSAKTYSHLRAVASTENFSVMDKQNSFAAS